MYTHMYTHMCTHIFLQREKESERKKHVGSVHQTCEHALFTSFPQTTPAIFHHMHVHRMALVHLNSLSQAAPAA